MYTAYYTRSIVKQAGRATQQTEKERREGK